MSEIQSYRLKNPREAIALLTESNLPYEDINNENIQLYEFRADGILMGMGGLEKAGSNVMIRSVAVTPGYQNNGIGKSIIACLEKKARDKKQKEVYLLTEIPDYFVKLKYHSLERRDAPDSISKTEEFRALCPESATLMIKRLV